MDMAAGAALVCGCAIRIYQQVCLCVVPTYPKGLRLDDAELLLSLLADDFKLRALHRGTIKRYDDVPGPDEGGHANGGVENAQHSTSGCRMQF